jgi:protein involved in polysaccharide export with SLBB domain
VNVFGAVDISSSLIFRPGLRVKDYLDRAGLRQAADIENIIILRADGSARTSRIVTQRRSLLARRGEDLLEQQVYPGESILVPEEIDRRSPYARSIAGAKDWTQLIYQFGLGAAAFKVLRQ